MAIYVSVNATYSDIWLHLQYMGSWEFYLLTEEREFEENYAS